MYVYIEMKTCLRFSLRSLHSNHLTFTYRFSSYQAKKAKKLFQEKGILSFPNSKKGKPLPNYIEAITIQFYEDNEYPGAMPGINHFSLIYIYIS